MRRTRAKFHMFMTRGTFKIFLTFNDNTGENFEQIAFKIWNQHLISSFHTISLYSFNRVWFSFRYQAISETSTPSPNDMTWWILSEICIWNYKFNLTRSFENAVCHEGPCLASVCNGSWEIWCWLYRRNIQLHFSASYLEHSQCNCPRWMPHYLSQHWFRWWIGAVSNKKLLEPSVFDQVLWWHLVSPGSNFFNSLCPSAAIRRWRTWSTLFHVMACCRTAPSHYLNQSWFIGFPWHPSENNFRGRAQEFNPLYE